MIELPILDGTPAPQAPADAATESSETPRTRFWRSIAHLKKDPAFKDLAKHEFMPGATAAPSGPSRRQFMQLMGASMALAGLTACRRPVEKILPYARKPEEVIPGIPLHYATAMPYRGVLRGLLVEAHEGRPTKVEGNPEHPGSLGSTGVFEQASVLNLYDPDRSQVILNRGNAVSWDDFRRWVDQFRVGAENKRLVVMSEPTSSLTVQALRNDLQEAFPQMRWITYRPEGENNQMLGMQQAYGRPLRPSYNFSDAEVIVSLDGDFLGPTDINMVANSRTFANSRRLTDPGDATMSRLYVVESAYTNTGAMADHRLRLRSADVPFFAAAIAERLGMTTGGAGAVFADHPYVAAIADDLQAAGSRGVLIAGETQPPFVHALCAAINDRMGSTLVELLDTGETQITPQSEELRQLTNDMRAGRVDALVMLGVNPVYSAPPDLGFAEALPRVGTSVHIGLFVDETAQAATWHLPRAHYLESWSDGRAYDGTVSPIQPLIAPLYEPVHSDAEILNLLATGLDSVGYDIVRSVWRTNGDALGLGGPFEQAWRRVLHDGFVPETRFPAVEASANMPVLSGLQRLPVDAMEVVFRLDPTVLDGSYSNNAWCQELPDPITKIVWDNVAVMSPATAETLGIVAEYDAGIYEVSMAELTLDGRSIVIPAWIVPGHADNSISLNIGYGRTINSDRPQREPFLFDTDHLTDVYGHGSVGTDVGVNVNPLRTAAAPQIAAGVQVVALPDLYTIVTTQDHGLMEDRPLVRMATLDTYRDNPDFALAMEPTLPEGEPWTAYPELWENDHPADTPSMKDNPYYKNQWGMVIDLNACTGCNACIVACQSENNVQVVGKGEVGRGRELHWIRLDRYFVTPDGGGSEGDELLDPMMVVQPVPCMHCENAPCESVCPVAATVHSPDGTNQMIYNRCIGTRYCSNNCPYKVRRYNWFNWIKHMPVTVQMAQNPDVTTRFRGVMEKCSYCIQRVREVQQRAGLEDRPLFDGEVKTACQQACPAEAITFGDLNDPNSEVNRWKRNERRYEMLAYLNVKPRTSYLSRVLNPNPRLTQA